MLSNQQTAPVRTGRLRRAAISAVTIPVALALLSGCGLLGNDQGTITVGGTAGPADAGQSTSANADPSPSVSGSTSSESTGPKPVTTTAPAKPTAASTPSPVASKCTSTGPAIPKGAGKASTADLDGDGKLDTIWLADLDGDRTLGVQTASGHRFATVFTSAAPQAAAAVAGRLSAGFAVILLNTGRSVSLYTVIGCAIVPTQNVNGKQYQFDLGFTGYGSGVGCPEFAGEGPRLVGYLAKPNADGKTFDVTLTKISLTKLGLLAVNGKTLIEGTKLLASSSIVTTAQSVSCGDGKPALEPQT